MNMKVGKRNSKGSLSTSFESSSSNLICIRHGATPYTRKICSHEGCTKQAKKGGVCIRHGAKVKLCSHEGCTNQIKQGGVCWRHGARVVCSKICSTDGYTKLAQKQGVCIRHGAKLKDKYSNTSI